MPSAAQDVPLLGLGGKSMRIGKFGPAADVAATRIDAAMATAAVSHAKRTMSPPPLLFCRSADPNPSAGEAASADSTARLERALDLPIGVALRDVAPLVATFLAAGERELDLRAAVLEVHPRRHERQPALAHLADERRDLPAMEEQLAVAVRIVVHDVRLPVLGDVRADQPDLAVAYVGVCLLERGAAVPERLHLRAREHEPRLEALEQVVF